MLQVWLYTLLSVLVVSLISFIGIFTFSLSLERLKKILLILVSFSAGALLGGAFLHLLPEIAREGEFNFVSGLSIILGIIIFFILEKFIAWRHCHIPTSKEHPHPLASMNLLGDGFHNLVDGMIIAGSFMIDINLGLATTVAVILHEIPQEMGDFGVLIYAGLSKKKALLLNFITASSAVLGAVLTLLIGQKLAGLTHFLIPFTAGGFIYIANSDLIPELKKVQSIKKSAIQLLALVLGMSVMLGLLWLE